MDLGPTAREAEKQAAKHIQEQAALVRSLNGDQP
jgi:hypothetical protein